MTYHTSQVEILSVLFLTGLLLIPGFAHSALIDDLKVKISNQNAQIGDIEQEIKEYQGQLEIVGTEKKSLESAVKTLDISRKKIGANINLTQNKISATGLTINKLALDIDEKEFRLKKNSLAVAKSIRSMDFMESDSLIELLLAYDNLSDFWNEVEELQRFQTGVRDKMRELSNTKQELEKNKQESEEKKQDLTGFKNELSYQKKVLDIVRKEKDNLLTVTKNKESNYKTLIEEKEALRAAFERELFEFESQLRFAIDPESIPPVGEGVLAWPLDSVTLTQYFGNTKFASANPQVYNGSGHNGIDLRASLGTRIKSALTGTIMGIGNTDNVCPNASYGKWVLIKHNNGLSTLYAHLSLISVGKGDKVSTGDVIGYSGNSGYSTGPHLHFAVYASQGVEIRNLKSRVCAGTYTIPLADLKAYLNPLSYL
ncbi:peptidoglycan DD-metalloendopeptidase family protein [Patescibacteria group bacterium]|nr:peptidoglycan DD-metalloendopeptidase family protein [Patescibacteria group bacterium]